MIKAKVSDKVQRLDSALVDVGKGIKILSELSWEPKHHNKFIAEIEKGNPQLPEVEYPQKDLSAQKTALQSIIAECDTNHPLEDFISQTATSYYLGAQLIENLGKPAFGDISKQIYGEPRTLLASTKISALDAANHFINVTSSLIKSCQTDEAAVCLMAEHVKEEMESVIKPFFSRHPVEIVIDEKLVSKAAAGASKIRIRNFTCFSQADIRQLIEHEAFVHTLTLINGRNQQNLRTLGLGAPRTTSTQEGLALFAELITNSIDLGRLRRIAARVRGVDMALSGANFIDVFKFFLENGQSESESFFSAMRIFRGGDVKGKHVFTKDIVYLQDFVEVHKFLETALSHDRHKYPTYLFAGRVTCADIPLLEDFFDKSILTAPLYSPRWIKNKNALLAFLVYSRFVNELGLSRS